MAAIDFPNSPEVDDLFTQGDITWQWDGTVWKGLGNSTFGPAGVAISDDEPESNEVLWLDTNEEPDVPVPAGGSAGQVLSKIDSTDYNTQWKTSDGVRVFADAAARTSAIPTPLEGMVSYLEDSNNISLYNGSSWVPLPVGSGGTGATTLTSGGYLKGAGTSAITSQSGIPATDVTSGTFDKARMPVGSVLQVVSVNYGTQLVTSSSTFVTSNAQATITPRSTNSKIIILVSGVLELTSDGQSANIAIFRGGAGGTELTGTRNIYYQGGLNGFFHPITLNFLDSPSTTSATTYTLMIRRNAGTGGIGAQSSGSPTNITLMEVSA